MSIDLLLSKLGAGARQVSVSAQPAEAASGLFSEALAVTNERPASPERTSPQERAELARTKAADGRARDPEQKAEQVPKTELDQERRQRAEHEPKTPDERYQTDVTSRDDAPLDDQTSQADDQQIGIETASLDKTEPSLVVDKADQLTIGNPAEDIPELPEVQTEALDNPTQPSAVAPVATPEISTPQQATEAASGAPTAVPRAGSAKPGGQPALDPVIEADGADAEGDAGVDLQAARRSALDSRPTIEGARQQNAQTNAGSNNAPSAGGAPGPAPVAAAAAQAQSPLPAAATSSATPSDVRIDPAALALQSGRPAGEGIKSGQPVQRTAPTATPLRMDSIALRVAQAARTGDMRFEIQLDPPELGRIDVKLEIAQDGQLRAQLATERPETFELLQRDARVLHKALEATGLKVDENSIDVSLRDQTTADERGSDQAGGGSNSQADPEDDPDGILASLDPSIARSAIRAAMGGVDRTI